MSLNCSYKEISWCNTLFKKSDDCLSDCSIIVPDSMADIAKIISVKSYPSVTETKSDNGRITVSGHIKINVLYISEDDNGKVCTLSSSVPYSHIVTSSDITDEYICLADISSNNSVFSIINSRKLKVSTLLRFCVACYKNSRIKLLSQAEGAEARNIGITACSANVICRKNVAVNAECELPPGKKPISKLLRQHARVADYDFKALNNKLIIKGNLALSILYLTDDSITDSTISVPFTEVIEAEGMSPSAETRISLKVSDCQITPDTNLSGEYTMLDAAIVLSATLLSFSRGEISAVSDIFLPGGALSTEQTALRISNLSAPIYEEEFIKESLTLPSSLSGISRVFDVDCFISDLSLGDGCINATVEATVMYCSENSDSVNTFTAKVPLNHKLSLSNPENPHCEIAHIGYAITGADSLELRLSARFSAIDGSCDSYNIFTFCEQTDYTPKNRPSITVTFINPGDTLWSIAKKYNISLSKLAAANAIDENAVLTVGEKLLIPR